MTWSASGEPSWELQDEARRMSRLLFIGIKASFFSLLMFSSTEGYQDIAHAHCSKTILNQGTFHGGGP